MTRSRPNAVCHMTAVLVIGCCGGLRHAGGGEFLISLANTLAHPLGRAPSIAEIERAAKNPKIVPLACFKLYGSQNHHFVPKWSLDGKSLAFLQQDIKGQTTKAMVFYDLSSPQLTRLFADRANSYEYMFSWSCSRPFQSFVLSSTMGQAENMDVYFHPTDGAPVQVTQGQGMKRHPSLYMAGGAPRVLYESGGEIFLATPTNGGFESKRLALGIQPRWLPDGQQFVYGREKGKRAGQRLYDLCLKKVGDKLERRLTLPLGLTYIRSPTSSPTGRHVAVFASKDQKRWGIVVVPTKRSILGGTVVARDVVMDEQFDNVAPAWDPYGQKILYFSKRDEVQGHYPLRWVDIETGKSGRIPYPKNLTTANGIAVASSRDVCLLAFSAVRRLYANLYVVILNHF